MKYQSLFAAIAIAALGISVPANAGPALNEALSQGKAICKDKTCTILRNPGGEVNVFQYAAQEVLAEGWHLEIDGVCASACVILADLARRNTCVTIDAEMALHKASKYAAMKTGVDGVKRPVGLPLAFEDPPGESKDINDWVYATYGGYPQTNILLGMATMNFRQERKFWAAC